MKVKEVMEYLKTFSEDDEIIVNMVPNYTFGVKPVAPEAPQEPKVESEKVSE